MSEPLQEHAQATQEHHFKRSFVNRIVRASIDQKLIVVFVTLLLIGVGIWSLQRLPVDAYPDLSPPMVEIVTQWPGHAAEEVERLITAPTELVMNGLPGLRVMRSVSLYGLSDVTLTFGDKTDNYFARQLWTEIEPGGPAVLRAHGDRSLFLCWPPNNSAMATNCLKRWAGTHVIHVGE